MATCESCPFIGPCELYPDLNGMLLCEKCIMKEEAVRLSPAKQQERVNNQQLESARAIDMSVELRTDIFNSEMVSINELKQIIDNDPTIREKHFTLAQTLLERYKHFQKVIFDKQAEITTESNKQRAVQTYLNQLSNKLRLDQRERLKLQDLSYKPHDKPIVKPKEIKTRHRFDKEELANAANETGFPLAVIQSVCIQKNMTPKQAAEHLMKVSTSTK